MIGLVNLVKPSFSAEKRQNQWFSRISMVQVGWLIELLFENSPEGFWGIKVMGSEPSTLNVPTEAFVVGIKLLWSFQRLRQKFLNDASRQYLMQWGKFSPINVNDAFPTNEVDLSKLRFRASFHSTHETAPFVSQALRSGNPAIASDCWIAETSWKPT